MLNLDPAAATLTGLVVAVRDDQLTAPTPCPGTTLGAMLDHVNGLSLAFAAAATKEPLPLLDQLIGLTGRDPGWSSP